MNEQSDDLKAFLDSVLVSQGAGDENWRNMGRWMGLYFLGALSAGVEAEAAFQLTVACQETIFTVNRPT